MPADVRTEAPKSVLLMAIVEPDIFTARVHRDRAVALRWVLRDINLSLQISPQKYGDDSPFG